MSKRVPDAERHPTTPKLIENILNMIEIALAGRGINITEITSITNTAIKTFAITFFNWKQKIIMKNFYFYYRYILLIN